jgi:tellurite resistance protein
MEPESSRPPLRLTPNLFGIAFGICGLAECWAAAHDLVAAPSWPAVALWVLAGIVWLATLVAYFTNIIVNGRLRADLADPTYAPFISLIFIVAMLLGAAVAEHHQGIGEIVFVVALIFTLAFGGGLTAQWIVADMQLSQWHPGYFLPTVAGGLIASACSAALGYHTLASVMFGYGMTCWLVLGSILLLRLFTQPALPTALLPTIAIELAPPVVAANAWFEIIGARLDMLAMALAGYGFLMVMVQLRLIPIYRRVPFGPGWWSFSFSYAAAFVLAIRWSAVEHVAQQEAVTYALLAIITAGMAALAVRTVRHLVLGTFFPRPPASGFGTPDLVHSIVPKGQS